MSAHEGDPLARKETTDRPSTSFKDFLIWLKEELDREVGGLEGVTPQGLFSWGETEGVTQEEMVRKLGEFCGVPFLKTIESEDVDFRSLPRPYCQSKLVVPVKSVGTSQTLILSNPFDWDLLDDLRRTLPRGRKLAVLLAAPETLRVTLAAEGEDPREAGTRSRPAGGPASEAPPSPRGRVYDPDKDPGKTHPVAKLATDLLSRAASAGASDLILEPRKSGVVAARALLGGDLHVLQEMPEDTGRMLVARLKSLSGMDLARRRTPQRGRMDVVLRGNVYRLRLLTAPTSSFENLSIRILDPSRKPRDLTELGMTADQADTLLELARQDRGLLLAAGPVGSGKSSTLYSVLSALQGDGRSVASVEDPVECRLPWIDQKEVAEEEGATLEVLLGDVMGEEPDVLLLSEISGLFSAKAAVEYAGAGYLALASMNTSNCTTAILRLERLGVTWSMLADTVIGLVAQRLLRKLCPECKEVRPLSSQEASLLGRFTEDLPPETAHPAGCPACMGTGYRGRVAVFEVIRADREMAEKMAEGKAGVECREILRRRGGQLMGDHAIQRIRDHVFPVEDAYREVLLEELTPLRGEVFTDEEEEGWVPVSESDETRDRPAVTLGEPRTVLVVDDDESTRVLLDRILSVAGFRVIQASDGGEALLKLGRGSVDLILSDIHMPSLDGLKLLEILHLHRIDAPVLLLTAEPSPDVEARCLEMGALDYLRKPIEKSVLLARIRKALGESMEEGAPGKSRDERTEA